MSDLSGARALTQSSELTDLLRDAGIDVEALRKNRAAKQLEVEAARKAAELASQVAADNRVRERAVILVDNREVGLWLGKDAFNLKRVKHLKDATCPGCGFGLFERLAYQVAEMGGLWREARRLDEILRIDSAKCGRCGKLFTVVFEGLVS